MNKTVVCAGLAGPPAALAGLPGAKGARAHTVRAWNALRWRLSNWLGAAQQPARTEQQAGLGQGGAG